MLAKILELSKDRLPQISASYKEHYNDQGGQKRRSCHSVKVLVKVMRISVELKFCIIVTDMGNSYSINRPKMSLQPLIVLNIYSVRSFICEKPCLPKIMELSEDRLP